MSSAVRVSWFAPAIAEAPVHMFVSRYSLGSEAGKLFRKQTTVAATVNQAQGCKEVDSSGRSPGSKFALTFARHHAFERLRHQVARIHRLCS